jgi:glycosyltransferase involved in cell wall biosynthesis
MTGAASRPEYPGEARRPLRILHVMRAPVGGLFRHVLDLGRAQLALGHEVGVVADSLTGGERAEQEFAKLRSDLTLGLLRTPIHRAPHWSDLTALRLLARRIDELNPDVVHGHGAKGGFLARMAGTLARRSAPVRAYTPHGGTIHFRCGSFAGALVGCVEFALAPLTDVFLFESQYAARRLAPWVRWSRAERIVVGNGLYESEFLPVAPAPDAADFVFVGELRQLKGVGTLVDALALLRSRSGATPRLAIIGSGPYAEVLRSRLSGLGLTGHVAISGPAPARDAFRRGRVLVAPSHAESLPYIVLEAAAARIPMIATDVGGIPEIFGPFSGRLIRANDAEALADAMHAASAASAEELRADAALLAERVAETFSITKMRDRILSGYEAGRRYRKSLAQPAQAGTERACRR